MPLQLPTSARPRHVVIDLTPMLPGGENGGAKWFVLALLGEWARLGGAWRWTLLTTADNDHFLAEMFPSMARICVIGRDRQEAAAPFRLTSFAKDNPVDLLYAPFTAPFYAHPAVPTVATVYDLQFIEYPQFFAAAQVQERSGNFWQAVSVAERLVCISDYVRQHVLRVTGLAPERVVRVHISLPDRLPPADPAGSAGLAAELGVTPGRYLIYPANTWPHKNHIMLLTAAGMYFARQCDSDLKIVCVGTGEGAARQGLIDAAGRMGLGERFLFPGFLSEPDLAALIAGARALIYPSLFEGFGMPVLEAMALGVPALVSNRTSLPEVAGDAALMFDPRRPTDIVAAITAIETTPGLAADLAARGRQQAGSLGTAASMAASYLAIFAEVVAADRRFSVVIKRRARRWMEGSVRRVRRAVGTAVYLLRTRNVRGFLAAVAGWGWARMQFVNVAVAGWVWARMQEARAPISRRFPFVKIIARAVRRVLAR